MIFKNILLLSLTLGIVLSLTLSSVYATEAIDQSFTGPFDARFLIGTAQTFVPTQDNVSSIDVYIVDRTGTPGTFRIAIFDHNTKVVLGETIVRITPSIDTINPTATHVSFTNPIPVVSGLVYDLSIKSVDSADSTYLAGNFDNKSYPNGSANSGKGSTTTGDIGFATYYEVPTPEEQTQEIVDGVLDLLTSGDISTQSANSLTSTLENAIDKIEDGNTTSATGMLGAFINKVEQMIQTGKISSEDGQALIDAANSVINSL